MLEPISALFPALLEERRVYVYDAAEGDAGEAIPISRGGGVEVVRRDKVVDGGHIGGVVGGANGRGEATK
jgi:hypothetical protein